MTIGIASYNQQEYLPEAIESALDQTVNCKIIVCNDGSTDNSLEIARKYPVRVIDQVNKGLASARNTIIMNADDDWILFLDADDKLMPNCVERIEQVIKENPDADVIAPSMKCFGTSDQEVILMSNPKLEDFRQGNRLGYCAAIKTSVLKEIGGYSPRMVEGYEDLHLTMNLLTRNKKVIIIPEILWLYRMKSESMWTKTKMFHAKLLGQINKDFPSAQLDFKHNAES